MNSETTHFSDDLNDRRQESDRRVAPCQCPDTPDRRTSAADRRSAGLHAIARSFGLHPENLELVDHDDPMEGDSPSSDASSSSWESLSRKCAELEARMAEGEEEAARFRSELEELRRRLSGK